MSRLIEAMGIVVDRRCGDWCHASDPIGPDTLRLWRCRGKPTALGVAQVGLGFLAPALPEKTEGKQKNATFVSLSKTSKNKNHKKHIYIIDVHNLIIYLIHIEIQNAGCMSSKCVSVGPNMAWQSSSVHEDLDVASKQSWTTGLYLVILGSLYDTNPSNTRCFAKSLKMTIHL